jgi:hypothetical protein
MPKLLPMMRSVRCAHEDPGIADRRVSDRVHAAQLADDDPDGAAAAGPD